jgi:hypothetical protein
MSFETYDAPDGVNLGRRWRSKATPIHTDGFDLVVHRLSVLGFPSRRRESETFATALC